MVHNYAANDEAVLKAYVEQFGDTYRLIFCMYCADLLTYHASYMLRNSDDFGIPEKCSNVLRLFSCYYGKQKFVLDLFEVLVFQI